MKLEVWHRGLELFDLAFRLAAHVSDFKLKSQFTDAAQSVSANIAEGYGRRTLADYLYFLYVAKGSLGEALTRAIGLRRASLFSAAEFEQFDTLHYEVENKLLGLIQSLEAKQTTGQWKDSLPPHPDHPSPKPLPPAASHSSTSPSYPQPVQPSTRSSTNPPAQGPTRATPQRVPGPITRSPLHSPIH